MTPKIVSIDVLQRAMSEACEIQDNRFAVINERLITVETCDSLSFVAAYDASDCYNASYTDDLRRAYTPESVLRVAQFDTNELAETFFLSCIRVALTDRDELSALFDTLSN